MKAKPPRLVLASPGAGAPAVEAASPTEPVPSAATGGEASDGRHARLALAVFVAYLVVAGLLILFVIGDYRWFMVDEWEFLSARSATDLGDLFRPWNQHWSTVPILIWRALFNLFGVASYLPYQFVVVVLHLTVAALLRVTMRRAGAGPWLSTAVASVFVLFGPGQDNIVWAFQMGFDLVLVLGLAQVLLADHDGHLGRRDALGVGAGLLALMSAGGAPALIGAAGLVALVRRGWWPALVHTVPLGIVYAVWYLRADASLEALASESNHTEVDAAARPALSRLVSWTWSGETGAFMGLGQARLVAIALAAVLVTGTVVAATTMTREELRRRATVPAALLAGSVAFQFASGYNRYFFGDGGARGPRYLHAVVALTLPALGFAIAVLVRRWRVLAPVLLALVLVPIPWQIQEFEPNDFFDDEYFARLKVLVVDLAHAPEIDQVPPWVRPSPALGSLNDTTAGWLIDQRDRGRLPERPEGHPPTEPLALTTRLGVAQTAKWVEGELECVKHTEPLRIRPEVGDELILGSEVWISPTDGENRLLFFPVTYNPRYGQVLSIQLPDLHLQLEPSSGRTYFRLCEAADEGGT